MAQTQPMRTMYQPKFPLPAMTSQFKELIGQLMDPRNVKDDDKKGNEEQALTSKGEGDHYHKKKKKGSSFAGSQFVMQYLDLKQLKSIHRMSKHNASTYTIQDRMGKRLYKL